MPKTLSPGDAAPDFQLPVSETETVSLKTFRKQKLVLYFYPKDDTSGCTKEAIDFTARAAQFRKAGAVILGCSRDSLAAHAKFRDKHDLKVLLGSDSDGQVTQAYGVWVKKSLYGRQYMGIERATFLIDDKGRIAHLWRKVKVPGHVEEVLSFVKEL